MVKMRICTGARPRATHGKGVGNHRSNDMEQGLSLGKSASDRGCLWGWMNCQSSADSSRQSCRHDNDIRVGDRGGDEDGYP